MPGNYSHTTRADGSILTGSIYNADHTQHITFATPGGIDDYSTNVGQMQSAVDPGEVGTESLPTDLAGEIQRLRTLIKEMTGKTYWYETPVTTLAALNALSRLTLATEVASTSGTTLDFTGIPAGTKRITILFNGVSLSGTSLIYLRLGDAGGFEDTGYVAQAMTFTGGTGTQVPDTVGFPLHGSGNASSAFYGAVTLYLRKASTFSWSLSGNLSNNLVANASLSGGSKSLSAELTQIRLMSINGSDTFDAGTVNITYE